MLVKPNNKRFQYRTERVLHVSLPEYVGSFPYLGHVIKIILFVIMLISKQRLKLNAVGYQLIMEFPFFAPNVKQQLIRPYFYSIFCNLIWCKLTRVTTSKLRVTHNYIFRRLVCVPRRTSAGLAFAKFNIYCLKVRARSFQEQI